MTMAFGKNDEEFEEDMKDELDSMMGLLDRIKDERQEELLSSQTERVSRLDRLKRSRHADMKDEQETSYSTKVESRRYVEDEPVEVKVRLGEDEVHREGPQKRKQDFVVAEIREKAEIISKSARKGPEDLASTLTRSENVEDDPEAAKYLQKIRDTDTTETKEKQQQQREKNTVVVDLPQPSSSRKTSVTVKLNLDMQKSKIAVARGAGLQGRRKPTSEHIRRSLIVDDDEEPSDVLAKFDADLEEDMDADDEYEPLSPEEVTCVEADVSESAGVAEARIMPQSPVEYGTKITLERRGSFEGLIPRATPKARKPAWKSKTYGGVALPAFAEAMKAGSKSLKKTDTAEKLLTADIVKQAAIDKLNRAAKEEMPEKEPEKPAWLVEAEARRKLHDRRRHAGGHEKIKPDETTDNRVIPIRLKKTGSKLFEEDIGKIENINHEDEEDNPNKFVFKLKHTVSAGEKQSYELEPAKISFKLKPTGIQLVEPEPPKEEDVNEMPVMATFVKDFETEPPSSPIRLTHLTPKSEISRPYEEDKQRVTTSVPLRHISPKSESEPQVEEYEKPSVRLRHVSSKTITNNFESTKEPELVMRLRLRGRAPPIYPDEDNIKITAKPVEQPTYRKPQEDSQVRKPQTPTTYEAPKPIKIIPTNDYKEPRDYNRAVTLERKPLETTRIFNQQPMRTTAESTPPLSQTRTTPKHFCKVTPIPSESTRRSSRGSVPRVYDLPYTPPSSKPTSPPISPSSKVVPHPVQHTPISGRSVLPVKANKGRRVSGERSRTTAVSGSEVQRIIPGRRTSTSDDPQRHPVRRTSSLEYPRSHVERAADGHLKHAVTVVKASNVPLKAKTVVSTEHAYSPRSAVSAEEILQDWKQGYDDSRRTSRTSDQDFSVRSWSSNKENEPRIVTQLEPLWMRELVDKKRNAYNSSNGDIQFDRMEALERLETKPVKTIDSDEEVREVPSFIKEFERKRKMKGRGSQGFPISDESYV